MLERPGRLQGHCRGREHRPNLRISVIRDLDIHAATGDHETMHITTEAELVKRHSANNQARFYRLAKMAKPVWRLLTRARVRPQNVIMFQYGK
jgi:hypothetical protein